MKIRNASNILEIACGAGLLLPFVIDQKPQETQYVATDLSPAMIAKAEERLRKNFEKYDSKLTFEEWTKKNNFILKQVNGEDLIEEFGKFDRVICNLVLMLTVNPRTMLTNAHKTTTEDALMGVTIWGDKTKSNFYTLVGKAIKDLGLPLSNKRSPFYYQEHILEDFKATGWELVCEWEQTAPFPLTAPEDIDPYIATLSDPFEGFSEEDKNKAKERTK